VYKLTYSLTQIKRQTVSHGGPINAKLRWATDIRALNIQSTQTIWTTDNISHRDAILAASK